MVLVYLVVVQLLLLDVYTYGMEQREDNSVVALGRVCSVLTPLLPPLAYNQCVCVCG
jgi:hypothetical protein